MAAGAPNLVAGSGRDSTLKNAAAAGPAARWRDCPRRPSLRPRHRSSESAPAGAGGISGNGELRASLPAPNATLKASGGGSSGSVVGSSVAQRVDMPGSMSFPYDEALKDLHAPGGSRGSASSRDEIVAGADLVALGALPENFLPGTTGPFSACVGHADNGRNRPCAPSAAAAA